MTEGYCVMIVILGAICITLFLTHLLPIYGDIRLNENHDLATKINQLNRNLDVPGQDVDANMQKYVDLVLYTCQVVDDSVVYPTRVCGTH